MLSGFPFLLSGQQENITQTIVLQFSDFVANKISVQSSGHVSLLLGRSGLLFAGEVKPKAARGSLSPGILNTHC